MKCTPPFVPIIPSAANLTAGTMYEVAAWAHTSVGDSPTALSHHQTAGTQPDAPLLKARALNQTAVDCSWTTTGKPAQVRLQHTAMTHHSHIASSHSISQEDIVLSGDANNLLFGQCLMTCDLCESS